MKDILELGKKMFKNLNRLNFRSFDDCFAQLFSQFELPHEGCLNLFNKLKHKKGKDERRVSSQEFSELSFGGKNQGTYKIKEPIEETKSKSMERGKSFGDLVLSLSECITSERIYSDELLFNEGSFEIVNKSPKKKKSKTVYDIKNMDHESINNDMNENVQIEE